MYETVQELKVKGIYWYLIAS